MRGSSLKFWTVASLVANQVIVLTGALVRLTKSGLGCPTWPQCSPGSYVPHPELGVHGVIEFGNRLLTFVLAAIAVGTFVAAVRAARRGAVGHRMVWLSLAAGLGIPFQAIIGGLSVLAQLNPWVVGLHMIASIVIIAICVAMVHLAFDIQPITSVSRSGLWSARAVTLLGGLVLIAGVVTTGAGPNSGDGGASRNGLPLEMAAKAHAWLAIALVAVTIWAVVALWRTSARRDVLATLVVEVLQGIVGYIQYFTHLPLGIVITHMLGTAVFSAVLANLALHVRAVGAGSPQGGVDGHGGEDEGKIRVG